MFGGGWGGGGERKERKGNEVKDPGLSRAELQRHAVELRDAVPPSRREQLDDHRAGVRGAPPAVSPGTRDGVDGGP